MSSTNQNTDFIKPTDDPEDIIFSPDDTDDSEDTFFTGTPPDLDSGDTNTFSLEGTNNLPDGAETLPERESGEGQSVIPMFNDPPPGIVLDTDTLPNTIFFPPDLEDADTSKHIRGLSDNTYTLEELFAGDPLIDLDSPGDTNIVPDPTPKPEGTSNLPDDLEFLDPDDTIPPQDLIPFPDPDLIPIPLSGGSDTIPPNMGENHGVTTDDTFQHIIFQDDTIANHPGGLSGLIEDVGLGLG